MLANYPESTDYNWKVQCNKLFWEIVENRPPISVYIMSPQKSLDKLNNFSQKGGRKDRPANHPEHLDYSCRIQFISIHVYLGVCPIVVCSISD